MSSLKKVAKTLLKSAFEAAAPKIQPYSLDTWGLQQTAAGLMVDGHSLADLARLWGTPLHVLRADVLDQRARLYQTHGCQPFVSVKTHLSANVLRRLRGLGLGAEVVSEYEYRLAKACGFTPDRILASLPAQRWSWFETLAGEGAHLINLNSAEEIAPASARAASLGLRPRTGLRVAIGIYGERFGEGLSTAFDAFAKLAQDPVLDWQGFHVHAGQLMRSEQAVQHFLGQVTGFLAELHRRHRRLPRIVDIGGALACPTTDWISARALWRNASLGVLLNPPDARTVPSPERLCALARQALDGLYRSCGEAPPAIYTEPGRGLLAPAQLSVLRVCRIKSAGDYHFAVLDGGTNILPIVASSYHAFIPVQSRSGSAQAYKLCGPLAHPGDVLVNRVQLSPLAEDDLLAVMDTGAYCQTASTQFSWLRPAQVMIAPGRAPVLLRRAEQLEDVLACDADLGLP